MGAEVRQFHQIVRGVDRHSDTSLGRITESAVGGVERFLGGDLCEPAGGTSRRRESMANYHCGPDRIVNVREPESCRYEFDVELRSACPPSPPPSEGESTDTG